MTTFHAVIQNGYVITLYLLFRNEYTAFASKRKQANLWPGQIADYVNGIWIYPRAV